MQLGKFKGLGTLWVDWFTIFASDTGIRLEFMGMFG